MKDKIVQEVLYILNAFSCAGYDAYAVGGCVRDCLLGKKPDDWDICTSATPDEITEVFSGQRLAETGLKHGTLTLVLNHKPYEITTFRTESGYSDLRHPDKVSFVKNVWEDLARRDFTVNAMAYNLQKGLVDLFGGQEDLKNRIIRCVGNPYERFLEDALRIMRAIRFSAVLDFEIEENTKAAINELSASLLNIAVERINVEFTKTLLADNCCRLYEYKSALSTVVSGIERLDKNTCIAINKLEKDKIKRLALFLMPIFSDIREVRQWLLKMRYDTKTINAVCDIFECKKSKIPTDIKQMRRFLSLYSFDTAKSYFEIQNALCERDGYKKALYLLDEVRKNKLCTSVAELKIDGQALIELGFKKGPEIGKVLNKLLDFVIDEKCENKEDDLKNVAMLMRGERKND